MGSQNLGKEKLIFSRRFDMKGIILAGGIRHTAVSIDKGNIQAAAYRFMISL
jgi:hypothetical protein